MPETGPAHVQLPMLALDTSGPFLQACLAWSDGAKPQFQTISMDLPRGHAEKIYGVLDDLFAASSLNKTDLKAVAATIGPGSFTGLRVGIAAARGLALALNIKALGIPNLWALSLKISPKDFEQGVQRIWLDARRNQAYMQAFSAPGIAENEAALVDAPQDASFASAKVDLELAVSHLTGKNQADFPPNPLYIRPADAKPQTKGIVRHQTSQTANAGAKQ